MRMMEVHGSVPLRHPGLSTIFRKANTTQSPRPADLVDATTLSLVSVVVQTVVLTLTLVVFIFQFRSQENAIKEASYQNLLGRYNDFIMSGQEADPLFARFLAENTDIKDSDLAIVRRLLISYGIIEEAYELYKKGWIDEEAWEQWNSWLKAIAKHPHFAALHKETAGMFDKDFQTHVTRLLDFNQTTLA
jgi:hypothetical protein